MNENPSCAIGPDDELVEVLCRHGFIGGRDETGFEALTGGVSSDIWKVTTADGRVFCVKRALGKLRVRADWRAPVERNRFEVAWCEIANEVLPGTAPEIIMSDPRAMLCVMSYFHPGDHHLWKTELRAGRADAAVAGECGRRLAAIHAATANRENVAARFPRSDIFHAIRLRPYLEATGERHPALRQALFDLSRTTAATRMTMIHGDVSPKNILIGPNGPVFLDAECACMGDPAFDLAFCLSHLLLKCLWVPESQTAFYACFQSLWRSYSKGVTWEPWNSLQARAAALLPALLLARVDGQSPVEYLDCNADKDAVRHVASALLQRPVAQLRDVLTPWKQAMRVRAVAQDLG